MADESKDWWYLLPGVATLVFAYLKWKEGGKQKVSTENRKTDYEAEGQKIDNQIKSEEYYKREGG